MSDPYLAVAEITADGSMNQRVTACAYEQARTGRVFTPDPTQWVYQHRWEWAASPSWGEKWAYAKLSGNEDPGSDAAVITDADILSTVQFLVPEPPPEP
jgi:hypothetical protein